MAYSDYTLEELNAFFDITLEDTGDYFADTAPIALNAELQSLLLRRIPLALSINTEKARSELIIAPLLLEAVERAGIPVGFFSGVEFSPDPQRGLRGTCDYMLTLSKQQLFIEAPVVAIAEAKNENLKSGFPQCIAEMRAAQYYNDARNAPTSPIFGVVTTGNLWKFLRLIGQTAFLDRAEYHIDQPDRVLGILLRMLHEAHTLRQNGIKSTERTARELP